MPSDSESDSDQRGQGRALKREEKIRLELLAMPTLALAFAITMVSTYLSVVTRHYTHSTVLIGVIIGSEGVMALWVPLVAGSWSDQARSRLGGRLPFVLAGSLPAAVALVLIGFMHTLIAVAVAAAAFFLFYFVAYEPYRAMYPDLVEEEEVAGRAQSTQAVSRGAGTGLALLGGGLMLGVARQLPFVVAAVLLVVAVAAFAWLVVRRGLVQQRRSGGSGPAGVARELRRLLAEHPVLRAYLIANALWEMSLAALKAFVILYLTRGLGYGLSTASYIIGGTALVILVGAVLAGKLGDRFGRLRIVNYALVIYGLGYVVPIFTGFKPAVGAALPFIAVGGGALMTLAYAILMPLMPEGQHGALTGFYSVSRGIGIVLGPILAGVCIELLPGGLFSSTHGFQAMWIVCAAGALGSLPAVRFLRRHAEDREALQQE